MAEKKCAVCGQDIYASPTPEEKRGKDIYASPMTDKKKCSSCGQDIYSSPSDE